MTTTTEQTIAFHADYSECPIATVSHNCPRSHEYVRNDPNGQVGPDAVRYKKLDVLAGQMECPVTGRVLDFTNVIFSADERCLPHRAFHESVTEDSLMRAMYSDEHPVSGKDLSRFQRARGLERTSLAWAIRGGAL